METKFKTQSEQYYSDLADLKYQFIKNCPLTNTYEKYKLWAHWLIKHLCQTGINYHIIPSATIENDVGIVSYLRQFGLDDNQIVTFYRKIVDIVRELWHKFDSFKKIQVTNQAQMIEISRQITSDIHIQNNIKYYYYHYHNIYVKFDWLVHEQLIDRYNNNAECLPFLLFEIGFNYYILDGYSFQWSIPPRVFNTLNKLLNTETEFFVFRLE